MLFSYLAPKLKFFPIYKKAALFLVLNRKFSRITAAASANRARSGNLQRRLDNKLHTIYANETSCYSADRHRTKHVTPVKGNLFALYNFLLYKVHVIM